MTTALERIPEKWRPLLIDVLERREPSLLFTLETEPGLTEDQSQQGMKALQWEFIDHLGADDEPTAHGKILDELVDVFINCFIMS